MFLSIVKLTSLKHSPGNGLSIITVTLGKESHKNGGNHVENIYGKTVGY